jgi:hypothetical protein
MPQGDLSHTPNNEAERKKLQKDLDNTKEEQLRDQVRDFVSWLKSEGII